MRKVLSLSPRASENMHFSLLRAHIVVPERRSRSHLSSLARRFLFGDGWRRLSLGWLRAGPAGAQPMAPGWLIVALSCHHGIFTRLISPLSNPSCSKSSVTLSSKEKPPSSPFPGVFVWPIFSPCNPRKRWMHDTPPALLPSPPTSSHRPAWLEQLITLSILLLIRNYRSLGLEIPVKSACPQRDSPNYCSPNESWMHSLKAGHNVNVPLTNHPFQISPV